MSDESDSPCPSYPSQTPQDPQASGQLPADCDSSEMLVPGLRTHPGADPSQKRRRVLPRSNCGGHPADGLFGGQCTHPATFAGMCVVCGAPADQQQDSVALKYIHPGFRVTQKEADSQKKMQDKQLASNMKLLLVLDLDHTLLNSVKEADVAEWTKQLERCAELDRSSDGEPQHLFHLPHMRMWTKLRPSVKEFLVASSKLFELYIYTMGSRDYAMQMASILDPSGAYFRNRIIGQEDSTVTNTKSLDIVLGSESKALILDDTEAVWPHHKANVIRIERYLFFPNAPGHFGLRCPSLMSLGLDEDHHSGALASTLRVLREVHRRYFESHGNDHDARAALRAVKQTILDGCHLVLSRAFPLSHPLARLAVELGATCELEPHEGATHVVAGSLGTEKAKWGKSRGLPVVSPRWVEASANLWSKADEGQFPATEAPAAEEPKLSREQEAERAMAAAAGG